MTFVALFSLLLVQVAAGSADARPANIVIIYADDLGWGDLGCQGHPKFRTPNIDSLAKEGVRLTQFQSCCPYCAPSRAGLLTGRYPLRNGVTTNPTPDAGINDVGLPDSEVTLAEALKAAGYATSCIGKWHLGHRPRFYPTRHGFEEYFGILYSNDMRPVELWEGEQKIEYPVEQSTLTQRYTDRAIAFIERNRSRPFFLYLAHAMPHKPLAASKDFYRKSGAGLYGDVIAELDSGVGRVLQTLQRLDLEENTLVIFTSDNGPWYGGSTGGLRGMKGQGWEGGVRVPFLARWPGRIPPGRVLSEPAIILDLFPTCLAGAGVGVPKDIIVDGKNILPWLAGGPPPERDGLYSMRAREILAVRSGKWKLHLVDPGPAKGDTRNDRWIDPRAPDGTTILAPKEQARPSEYPGLRTGDPGKAGSLFDLDADPGEQHDLADRHPDVAARLKGMADAFRKELGN